MYVVHRYGEADALASAAMRENRDVDSHQAARGVDQRAARVAGIDRRVGLNEVLDRVRPFAHDRADDALCDRLADAERIAHRERDVADGHFVDVRERDGPQSLRVDLEQRDVRFRVDADDAGQMQRTVRQRDRELGRVLDYVIIGHDVAVAVDDDAGAEALHDHGG